MIFFLSYEVEPQGGSTNWKEHGGGQFNCWIRAESLELARKRALQVIASDGWIPKREDESRQVAEGHYDSDAPGRPHYDVARRDGEAFVVHTWPPDGDKEAVTH